MRISVKVHPRARQERVEQTGSAGRSPSAPPPVARTGEGEFEVWVREPPEDGRANKALVELLAKHFGVPKAEVRIVRGAASRRKVVEIPGAGAPTVPAPSPAKGA